nr:hemin uptake protein HemP [uncultured Moellerella sp.]
MVNLQLKLSSEDKRPASPSETVEYIDSHQLLGTLGRVHILHQGEIYQLRQTRAGKLILTK